LKFAKETEKKEDIKASETPNKDEYYWAVQ